MSSSSSSSCKASESEAAGVASVGQDDIGLGDVQVTSFTELVDDVTPSTFRSFAFLISYAIPLYFSTNEFGITSNYLFDRYTHGWAVTLLNSETCMLLLLDDLVIRKMLKRSW
ncbi:uncharacterized protein LOC111279195 [Durio zibethinus]|uniref:Uncharacterized protein LOC111279195 n=1 Tax=Durio zibethinus TaxID=66656 RepID=A0A6P5X0B2_DURZI|nr:uncharacterized protein LOC111279195 [Durio zibethinus]